MKNCTKIRIRFIDKEIIEGADSTSFKVDEESYFTAEDKSFKYIWAEKRDRKSAVKNFIEAYFSTTNWVISNVKDKFQINNKDGELILNIDYNFSYDEHSKYRFNDHEMLTCYTSGESCLSRGDEPFWRKIRNWTKKIFLSSKKNNY